MLAFEKYLHRALLQTLLLVLYTSVALGTPPQPSGGAERWTALAETGFQHLELPTSVTPTALTQDTAGFVWVGTENGLARWDGYRFRTYQSDPASPRTLPDNDIYKLYTDSQGRLWIGTGVGGLARYDPEHDRFVRYPTGGPNGLSDVGIWDIAEDGAGGLWVATMTGGLDQLSPETGKVTHFRHDERDPDSLPSDRIRAVWRSPDDTLWVAAGSGLVRRAPGGRAFVPVPLPVSDGQAPHVSSLFEDSRQRLWIGTTRGAYVIEPKGTVARQILESDPEHSTLQTEGVLSIAEARPGEIWLGTRDHGIVAVDTVSFRTHRNQHDPTVKESLGNGSVYAMLKDRSGVVWICTTGLVSRYDPGQSAVHTIFGESSRHDGLTDAEIDAILQLPDGHVWLGLGKNGIDVVDPVGVRTGALRPDPTRPETALQSHVTVFARAESGEVYVGTLMGLYRVDPEARRATRLTLTGRDPSLSVFALLLQRGVLWVGGGGDGLWKVDLSAARGAARMALPARHVDGLSNPRVLSIQPDSAGSLWIGTMHGLNHFDPTSGALERILPDAADPAGALITGYVTALLTDQGGRLWVGTYGGGIEVMEGRDHDSRPRFRRLGTAQGLPNENVDMLLQDSRGRIWASTDNGLAVVDPASFAIHALQRAEGVVISNYFYGSGAVTAAGELLFGGVGGLTVVQSDRLNPWSYQPPVVVTDVRIGGKAVPSSYLNLSGARRPLTLTPSANSLAVEFAALDYSAPERNQYAYELEGFEQDWTESEPSRRLAAYNNLPPGDYQLRLRGSNRDGVWTPSVLTVPIRVLPAWFQTVAFKVLFGAAMLGLLLLVYRLRIRSIEKNLDERHLTRLAERDRIARELHDTLLQSTEGLILKLHSVVGRLAPDDPGRALLSSSLDRASELAYEGRERIKGLREGARPRPEIGQALEKVAREMGQDSALRVELKPEGRVRELRPYIWEELYRIGYEAVWNVYRHAHAGRISLLVDYGEHELLIRIGDDGRGIAPGVPQSAAAGGHFGLAGMRERARGMDAKLHIGRGEAGGTQVEIRIHARLAYVG